MFVCACMCGVEEVRVAGPATMPGICVVAEDLNSGPDACMANTLPTEPSLQLKGFFVCLFVWVFFLYSLGACHPTPK